MSMRLWMTFFTLAVILTGCHGSTNTYHVGEHGWRGDSIYFHLGLTADTSAHPSLPKVSVLCKSCLLTADPLSVTFDANGFATAFFPEAIHDLSVRLNVKGSGIDTTFIQKQRLPADAALFYKLDRPLIGRIFVTQTSTFYTDSTMDSVLSTAMVGDELNLFAETPQFYLIHHPLYAQPLWLLKLNAVRLF